MIASVRGVVEARLPDGLIVVVGGGVGLRLFCSAPTLAGAGVPGEQVHLHTHLYVREDILALYGFASSDELHLFEQLLTVSGIGPRVALNLLSAVQADSLRDAIAAGNAELLTRVPGVGRKTAERLVLELRGKLGARVPVAAAPTATGSDADVLSVLMSLGFGAADAQDAVRSIPPDAPRDVEERIRIALRHFQR